MIGAKINNIVFAELGKTVSFTNNFKPSASGCNNPKKPTTFGPLRCCIDAIILRSANVKYATAINNGIIKSKTCKTDKTVIKIMLIIVYLFKFAFTLQKAELSLLLFLYYQKQVLAYS